MGWSSASCCSEGHDVTDVGSGADTDGTKAEVGIGPVAESLLRRARSDAARIRARANAEADTTVAEARAEADRLLADARAAGSTEAAASAGTDLVRERKKAQFIVLAARRLAVEELRRNVHVALTALCEDPAVADRLRRLAGDRAGPGARITAVPDGGVIAIVEGRRVDCSIASLADHAVCLLGTEVERLWES
jgi:vacuolar-type H+-ATPase subunit E/Vma4